MFQRDAMSDAVLQEVAEKSTLAISETRELLTGFTGAIDSLVVGHWALVLPPLVVAAEEHPTIGVFLDRVKDHTVEPPEIGVDFEKMAAFLGVDVDEVDKWPIGGIGEVLVHMVDGLGFPSDKLDRLEPVVDAWLDMFDDPELTYEVAPGANGYLVSRTITTKSDFADQLAYWLLTSVEDRLGPSRGAVMHLRLGDVDLRLAGDSSREAVERFVEHWFDGGETEPWWVLQNQRTGKCNKVSFTSTPVRGWYLYLDEAWSAEGRL